MFADQSGDKAKQGDIRGQDGVGDVSLGLSVDHLETEARHELAACILLQREPKVYEP